MNFKNTFKRSILCLSLMACSAEKEVVSRIHFQATPDQTQQINESDYHWIDTSLQSDACKFLGSKRVDPNQVDHNQTIKPSSHFQLYQNIFTQNDKILGSHSVAKLPQLLFTLSGEAAEGGGTMYKSYDPTSFYALAKRELCPKIPLYCEKLIKHDEKKLNLEQDRRDLARVSEEITAIESERNKAQQEGEVESEHLLADTMTQKRVFRDHLNVQIARLQSELENLKTQVEAADTEQRKNATPEQIQALDNIQGLLMAIANWDSYWASLIFSVKHKYISGRNAQIESIINRRAPGALDGQQGDLLNSDLFEMYLRYLKIVLPSEDDKGLVAKLSLEIDSLRPILTSELSLFHEVAPQLRSWVDFERDVSNAIALLSTRPSGIEDATCKFVLSQRLIAQIISIKGIRQSPVVTADGTLEKLQSDPDHKISHVDIPGVFKSVVDEAWLQKAMNSTGQESPVPLGTIVDDQKNKEVYPVEYFAWVRALAHVVSSANSPFWIKNKAFPGAEELIPTDLLKLSFGMMVVGLQAMQTHFLRIEIPNVYVIPEDSAETSAALIHANIESLRAFDAQYKMHQEIPDMAFLNEKQLGSIKPTGDKKILLQHLLYAANKSALHFYNLETTGVEAKQKLRSAINRSGVYLKNESLYRFGFETPRN